MGCGWGGGSRTGGGANFTKKEEFLTKTLFTQK